MKLINVMIIEESWNSKMPDGWTHEMTSILDKDFSDNNLEKTICYLDGTEYSVEVINYNKLKLIPVGLLSANQYKL